jgi:hypothetical protein
MEGTDVVIGLIPDKAIATTIAVGAMLGDISVCLVWS